MMIVYRHGRNCNCHNRNTDIADTVSIICLIFIFVFIFFYTGNSPKQITKAQTDKIQSELLTKPTVNVGITSINP